MNDITLKEFECDNGNVVVIVKGEFDKDLVKQYIANNKDDFGDVIKLANWFANRGFEVAINAKGRFAYLVLKALNLLSNYSSKRFNDGVKIGKSY